MKSQVILADVDIPFLCNAHNEQRSDALLSGRCRVYVCVCAYEWVLF